MNLAVMDVYADADTRQWAQAWMLLQDHHQTYEPSSLLCGAERLAPVDSGCALIYGSGFERDAGLLERLARGRTLYGNSPETLRLINNPRCFFSLLNALDIPYPEVAYTPPQDFNTWLCKPCGGSGGVGIRPAIAAPPNEDHYYQRHLSGTACSALFLADGQDSYLVGFNTLWTAHHLPDRPYVFAGAINRTRLTDALKGEICQYLARLVASTGIKGLNSLDFIHHADQVRVLEINPRPSATLTLYDDDYAGGLLAWHVAACLGRLPDQPTPVGPVRAIKTFFPCAEWVVPNTMNWPDWCVDRPIGGTHGQPGQPALSLTAQGATVSAVLSQLETRSQHAQKWFATAIS